MSGQKPKKARNSHRGSWFDSPWLTGLLLVGVCAYLTLALTGDTAPWWQMITGGDPTALEILPNPGGPVGSMVGTSLNLVFGSLWCWLVPLVTGLYGLGLWWRRTSWLRPWLLRLVPLWVLSTAWLAQPQGVLEEPHNARFAGVVGFYLARGFFALFGLWGGRIFLTLFLLAAVGLLSRSWLPKSLAFLGNLAGSPVAGVRWFWGLLTDTLVWFAGIFRGVLLAGRRLRSAQREVAGKEPQVEQYVDNAGVLRPRRVHTMPVSDKDEPVEQGLPPSSSDLEELVLSGADGQEYMAGQSETGAPRRPGPKPKRVKGPVVLPGLDLLTPAGPETQAVTPGELDGAADLLEATLRSFGVEGEVKDVRPGPVVTTFEYQPGPGIKVSQIVQRSDDLALAMRARSIRMEAPIPGKAAVGIEIPNQTARMVRLREVLELIDREKRQPLSVVLGKDVVGRPVSVDLASLPHLLVAGSTGSGKSVCLNSIISNLLLHNTPAQLRLVLIDPKMLEMSVYNGIPHLLLPVVTDPREALKALQWMVAQMELRYRQLAKWSVRNILQFNEKIARGEVTDASGETVTEPMPYFLTIVDELADLMLQLGNECEGPITRLAQKARAVGIHLILATQRPSVDVLTGVIKANIPCRIAFRVIQKNDSRTILDMNGAQQLLGHGDMLYLQPGRSLPVRVHGSFIDVDECEAIAGHWRAFEGLTEEISLKEETGSGGAHTGDDDLFDDAKRIVVLHQSGSTSLLQRRLRIGYTRAGRLMDMLEEAGIVGPFTGSKAREVLIKPEELAEMGEQG